MRINRAILIAFAALATSVAGCKKSYLDTKPSDKVSDENLFTTTSSAYAVLNGMNRVMTSNYPALNNNDYANDWGAKTTDLADDVMGNDVVCNANNFDWFSNYYNYVSPRQSTYRDVIVPWIFYYKVINAANNIIVNIDGAIGPDAEKNDIKGQALAYRGWAYYKLSIYYCQTYAKGASTPGVPIYVTPTTAETKGNGRGTVQQVYDQITSDLQEGIKLITASGISHSDNKSFISLATANGIYAKVALVMENWAKANELATAAISNWGGAAQLMDSVNYLDGFNSATNKEFMWASKLNADQTTTFGNNCFFSFVDASASTGYAGGGATWRKITKQLFDLIPAADVRKKTFASDRKQTKFHLANPALWAYDNLYMRLAEMFLIKAEAEANLGQDANAITTLETLVKKRNANYSYATTPYYKGTTDKLREEIYLQRRVELFLEGFGYSDLRRLGKPLARPTGTGNHDISKAVITSMPATDARFIFMIPQSELDASDALGASDQNP